MAKNLFGDINDEYENFTLFQDEAGCEDSNFFYHGYLFVNNQYGNKILEEILKVKGENSRESEITFKEIKKDDYKVRITTGWLNLADEWLRSGKIRFYVLGVDKKNLKNFWDNSWRFEKNIYLKFFEIGINSSFGWFSNDESLNKPLKVTNIYYEHGDYNDERKDKIKWLESLSGYKNTEPIHSDSRRQKLINEKLCDMSHFIQLTDILLGATKYSFIKLNEKHTGRQKCVDSFIDIVERFNDKKSAYKTKSRYYKRYALQFFPTKSSITKEEFLSNDIRSMRDRGEFYCNRLTYRQLIGQTKNLKLF